MSYFTLFPSSVTLTRILKIGLRFVLTGLSAGLYLILRNRFGQFRLQWKMVLPLGFYLLYLLMGIISLIWSTGKSFTALQLAMTIETMVFAFIFFHAIVMLEAAYNIKRALYTRILARATLWISIVFLIGLFTNPDLFFRVTHGGEVKRLGGYIINPNELGMLVVLGVSMAYIEILNKQNQFYNRYKCTHYRILKSKIK